MMNQYQNVFKRYEKKYLLSQRQYAAMKAGLTPYMKQDQYGQHTICNLYLDTDDYQLIRTSLEKPVYKEKIRVRSYGVPQQGDTVFLELKKKYKGVVYKRRVSLPLKDAMHFLNCGVPSQEDSQIMKEIQWFLEYYQPKPKVFIGYDRTALFGRENSELRMTFDRNLRWRDSFLDLSSGDYGAPIITPEQILLEIKAPGAMPLWLCHLLSELEIYPVSFSKYGSCYKDFLACSGTFLPHCGNSPENGACDKKLGGMICA